jgi:hypothetical protein
LLKTCGRGVVFDNLANAPGGIRLAPIRFKEMRRTLSSLTVHILGKLTAEACRKEHVAIFVALTLRHPQLAALQIHITQAKPDEFGIAQAGKE